MSGEQSDYFRSPGPVWLVLVALGVALLTALYLRPDIVPYTYLGPVGVLSRHLVNDRPKLLRAIFYFTWAIHLVEAAIARRMCSKKNLSPAATFKWTVQTFIYGYFSLGLLRAYKGTKATK